MPRYRYFRKCFFSFLLPPLLLGNFLFTASKAFATQQNKQQTQNRPQPNQNKPQVQHDPTMPSQPPGTTWQHEKTDLINMSGGWSSNALVPKKQKNKNALGCGLVYFVLPPLLSMPSMNRDKIPVPLSLTTLPAPDGQIFELSGVFPDRNVKAGETQNLTLKIGNYNRNFALTALPPRAFRIKIQPAELQEIITGLASYKPSAAVQYNENGQIFYKKELPLSGIRPVLRNFQACLAKTGHPQITLPPKKKD